MRILLAKPHLSRATISGADYVELEPLELEYLAAGLPYHDVELIDMRYDKDLAGKIRAFQPHVVATTAYTVHVYIALDIMRTAKRISQDIFTVVGGHHATLMPQDFRSEDVDAIVVGEGVFAFKELVECLERGRPLAGVPGLWYGASDTFAFTCPRNDVERIDELPLPDRSISARYRKRYFYLWWRPAALIRASVGCAYRCAFCPIWKAAGGRWRYRSPESVADEIVGIDENFLYFCDDNALYDSARMATLCELLKARNVKKDYFFFARPDTVVEHPDLVERWAEIGLRQVFLGLEAVDAATLWRLNKRLDDRTNKEAVAVLKRNGVDPFVAFMVFPEFSERDFGRVYEYMEKLGVYYNEVSVLTPAPGSDLYWEKRLELTSRNYELFDYMHSLLPTGLAPREFYSNLARLWLRSYSPVRALRLRPATKPPLTPGRLTQTLVTALRNYYYIRRAYKPWRTGYRTAREASGGAERDRPAPLARRDGQPGDV
ncbi:MAG: cobalamin-dependent protein [Gemmatimonadota bacterium]|nr:MAG: cobalamin-dependent protein [Gemmatimonadota bacterium]